MLIHQYDAVDVAFIVQALADLPYLRAAVEALLTVVTEDDEGDDDGEE